MIEGASGLPGAMIDGATIEGAMADGVEASSSNRGRSKVRTASQQTPPASEEDWARRLGVYFVGGPSII
jgi:hypothetical protein